MGGKEKSNKIWVEFDNVEFKNVEILNPQLKRF